MQAWKLGFTSTAILLLLSGCGSNNQTIQLQNTNARQAMLIQKQQLQIEALQKQLKGKKRVRTKRSAIPKAPKKNIKLKKVEDDNYSSGYMYPGTPKKKKAATPLPTPKNTSTPATTATTSMGKAECVAMIGQDKFDKYTQMFGSEAASIKRCNMLRAMR